MKPKEKEDKSERITFRCTLKELQEIENRVSKEGVSISSFVRLCVFGEMDRGVRDELEVNTITRACELLKNYLGTTYEQEVREVLEVLRFTAEVILTREQRQQKESNVVLPDVSMLSALRKRNEE